MYKQYFLVPYDFLPKLEDVEQEYKNLADQSEQTNGMPFLAGTIVSIPRNSRGVPLRTVRAYENGSLWDFLNSVEGGDEIYLPKHIEKVSLKFWTEIATSKTHPIFKGEYVPKVFAEIYFGGEQPLLAVDTSVRGDHVGALIDEFFAKREETSLIPDEYAYVLK